MKLSDLDWLDNIYKSINLENLPHGIIINGPKGIGKEIFAKELASELLLNKNYFVYGVKRNRKSLKMSFFTQ